jgi:hypothetical protein
MEGSADLKIVEFYAEPETGFSKKDRDRGVIVSKVSDRFTLLEFQTFIERRLDQLAGEDPHKQDTTDQIRQFEIAKAYFDRAAVNSNNNPEMDIVMAQKIEVRHPLSTGRIDERIVWSYIPSVMIEGLGKEQLQALFAEIPDRLRKTVVQMLDETNRNTKDQPLTPSRELAAVILKDGVLHEDYHEKIYKHKDEDLTRAQQLLPKLFRGRIFFKNFIKALMGIQSFRLVERAGDTDFKNPSDDTWDLALRLFLTEMFCDLVPVQLKRRVGEIHVYESELGEVIPPEWERFLDELIDRHIEDYKNGQAGIYTRDHLAMSRYYEVRGINAS